MDGMQTPWELLDELDRPGALSHAPGRLRSLMAAGCRRLAPLLPQAAGEWLTAAEQYRVGAASAADLERVRVAAWDYLGADSCDFGSPRVLAVRAVICLLFPDDWGDDWHDVVHPFLYFSNGAGDNQPEQARLMRESFPECLGPGDTA